MFFVWAKNVKIFVSHVNAHQRITSREEDFNKQVDRMACSVDIVSIFSQPPPLPRHYNGLMNKMALVAGIEVMCRLSNMDFHSPGPPAQQQT